MMLASGNLSELPCKNQCPCTFHVFRIAIPLLNSTSVILLICGTMGLTLPSGFNITHSVNFNPHCIWQTQTLFDNLILWRITPLGTNYFHFVNGLIWHIKIRSPMALLNSPLSRARKLEIISPNQIGTSSKPIVICSTPHFCNLMCHHIPFMLTAVHTWRFTLIPLPVK